MSSKCYNQRELSIHPWEKGRERERERERERVK